ncbi:MAG: thioredoxin-dependent thiol peroxidase [Candidatus Thorarchaeota archaeon]|nr:thioredoxin-dependent thiol peroxidase [Candidatus Thorarchaeota archaeon]MCK5238553.1 thioredoxin-dependent thiol peroxidase [Candidatus Thorarchaeota archaeon]
MKQGDKAPDFETTTENGESFKLSELSGKKVMVFFYPKDDTPGCTAEACSIRDSWSTFTSNDIPVYGISGGSSKSHQKFRDKYDLPIPLLMDEEFHIAKLFGVYKKKKMYGKEYMGIERTTFLIDEEGKVEAIFGGPEGIDKVKTKEHANQVIQFWGLKL